MRHMSLTLNLPYATLKTWITKGLNIIAGMESHFIRWPTPTECDILANDFRSWCNLNGVVGAVDCSHIAINARKSERRHYTNRKCFYSVHLLAVVDACGRFLCVDIGCAGSMSDTSVLRTSHLASTQHLRVQAGMQPPIPYGKFLLADGGFTLCPWVVMNYTELECAKDPACQRFNTYVSKSRAIVERAFGQIKMRYKRIGGRTSFDRKERVCIMVRAACVLHNLTLETESTVFASPRIETDCPTLPAVDGVAELQKAHTVPAEGSYLGADSNVREAARNVRKLVANDALCRNGLSIAVTF